MVFQKILLFIFMFTLVSALQSANNVPTSSTTSNVTNDAETAAVAESSHPYMQLFAPITLEELNKTIHRVVYPNITNILPNGFTNLNSAELMADIGKQFESFQQQTSTLTNLVPNGLINSSNELMADLTKHLEALQNNTLVNILYNTSRTSIQASGGVLTDSLARPATFFLGQNLRLLGNGLGSLGQSLKHSGYHISNLEPVIQNASQALSEYGINLVNASMNNISQPIH